MKKDDPFSINNLWIFITIIFSFHYYFSYRWLTGMLESYGLNSFAIIQLQDVMFTFGNLNFTIISYTSIGFSLIFYLKLTLGKKAYAKADKIFKKKFIKPISNFYIHKSLKETILKAILTLFFLILILLILKSYVPSIAVFSLILLVVFIIPLTYVIWVNKRSLILGAYIFIILLTCNKIIDWTITNSTNDIITEVSFKYQEEDIKTNDSIIFLYQSYKYMILRNIKSGNNKLYDNDKVTFLTTKISQPTRLKKESPVKKSKL